MRFKKLIAGIVAAVAVGSVGVLAANAEILNGTDGSMFYSVNVVDILPDNAEISEVYGVKISFDEKSYDVLKEGATGSVTFRSIDNDWSQINWSAGMKKDELYPLAWDPDTNSVVRMETSPIFTEADLEEYAVITVSEWSGGDITVDTVALLDKNGNEFPKEKITKIGKKDIVKKIYYTDGVMPSCSVQVVNDISNLKVEVSMKSDWNVETEKFNFDWQETDFGGVSVKYPDGTIKYYQWGNTGATQGWDADGDGAEECKNGINGESWIGTIAHTYIDDYNYINIPVKQDCIVEFYCLSGKDYSGLQYTLKFPKYTPSIPMFDTVELSDKTVAIMHYNGNDTNVVIPSRIDKKTVRRIGEFAFAHCSDVKSVTIPDGVEIYNSAFLNCTSLKNVTFPKKGTVILDRGFVGCTSLMTVDLPGDAVIYQYGLGYKYNKNGDLEKINGFKINCVKNSDAHFYALSNGFSDEAVIITKELSDGTLSLEQYASTAETYNIPSKIDNKYVTKINKYCFYNGSNLKKVTIPDSVTHIGYAAFEGCTSLTDINIPENVEVIEGNAFYNCTSLKSITIPASVTTLNYGAIGKYEGKRNYENLDGFVIYCYAGTEGEKYAKANGMEYKLLKVQKPGNISAFKVNSITSTSVTLKWNKGTTASGYQLQQYKDGKWVTIYTGTKATNTSYTVKNLKAGTAGYRFRIRAYKTYGNAKQYGSWSSEVKVNTNPYGVGGFKCSSKTSTSVTLKWNKGTTASGYQLQQYKGGKWVTIYTGTKATNTSYTVKKLKAGTAGYRFRIRAYKTYGNTKQYGSWSSEVKVNTNPYGVGGFKCSSKSSTSVTLKWNKGTTASGYQLQQYKDGKWVTIYTGTKATNTSYTVKKLKAGTAGYRFRIRAYKTYGNTKQYGSWSSEVKVNTNPYGVGGFKCSSKTSTSVTLKWNKGTTASGYQLQQYKNGKWVTIYTGTKATSTSCTIKSLKANTSYKFRIRAYKTYGYTKQYGSWSKVLTVKTKR